MPQAFKQNIKNYLKGLRIPEVILMTGFFVIGAFFGIKDFERLSVLKFIILTIVSFFVVLSIYSHNAAVGKATDKDNKRLENLKQINYRTFIFSYIYFLLAAVCLSLFLSWIFSILSILVFLIWRTYSHPVYGFKHRPYLGTILHFVAQIIHFNMCYFIFSELSLSSLSISVYFALAFATGHLNHEIIDYKSDLNSKSRTTAVKHGVNVTLKIAMILLIINLALALGLFASEAVDIYVFIFMLAPVFLHLSFYIIFYKSILNKAVLIRNNYRIYYLISFFLIITIRFIHLI